MTFYFCSGSLLGFGPYFLLTVSPPPLQSPKSLQPSHLERRKGKERLSEERDERERYQGVWRGHRAAQNRSLREEAQQRPVHASLSRKVPFPEFPKAPVRVPRQALTVAFLELMEQETQAGVTCLRGRIWAGTPSGSALDEALRLRAYGVCVAEGPTGRRSQRERGR